MDPGSIDKPATPSMSANPDTPLTKAACQGHAAIVSTLIAAKADIKLAPRALGFASSRGHDQIVAQLIAALADVTLAVRLQDRDPAQTPLAIATSKGHDKVVAALVAAGAQI